jgi:hypothetical protein
MNHAKARDINRSIFPEISGCRLNPVKALQIRPDWIRSRRAAIGCGDGAAEILPVCRCQIGGVLQLINLSGYGAPSKAENSIGLGCGLDNNRLRRRRCQTKAKNSSQTVCAALVGDAIEISVGSLHQPTGRIQAIIRDTSKRV